MGPRVEPNDSCPYIVVACLCAAPQTAAAPGPCISWNMVTVLEIRRQASGAVCTKQGFLLCRERHKMLRTHLCTKHCFLQAYNSIAWPPPSPQFQAKYLFLVYVDFFYRILYRHFVLTSPSTVSPCAAVEGHTKKECREEQHLGSHRQCQHQAMSCNSRHA